MCLITEDKTMYTAEEDMVVYKILKNRKGGIFSPIESYKWELHEVYSAGFVIEEAYLKFCHDDYSIKFYSDFSEDALIRISHGFHSSDSIERLKKSFLWEYVVYYIGSDVGEKVYQCTIPKGANYYKDSTGLLVSNQLRVDKIVKG